MSEMERTKDSFKNVLKMAQKLGYAEPGNPKLDLNGYDALAKIKIRKENLKLIRKFIIQIL